MCVSEINACFMGPQIELYVNTKMPKCLVNPFLWAFQNKFLQ